MDNIPQEDPEPPESTRDYIVRWVMTWLTIAAVIAFTFWVGKNLEMETPEACANRMQGGACTIDGVVECEGRSMCQRGAWSKRSASPR